MKIGFHRFESTENQPSFLPVRKMLNAFDLCKAYKHENWNESHLRDTKTNLRFCLLFILPLLAVFMTKFLYNIRTLETISYHFKISAITTKSINLC